MQIAAVHGKEHAVSNWSSGSKANTVMYIFVYLLLQAAVAVARRRLQQQLLQAAAGGCCGSLQNSFSSPTLAQSGDVNKMCQHPKSIRHFVAYGCRLSDISWHWHFPFGVSMQHSPYLNCTQRSLTNLGDLTNLLISQDILTEACAFPSSYAWGGIFPCWVYLLWWLSFLITFKYHFLNSKTISLCQTWQSWFLPSFHQACLLVKEQSRIGPR